MFNYKKSFQASEVCTALKHTFIASVH